MKDNFKKRIKENKYLYIIAKRIQNKSYLNSIEKRIRGKNNKIEYSFFSILKKVEFDILGNNNNILISKNARLNNVKFHIRGNGHKIILNENVSFSRGGSIWFEDNNGRLDIGANTTFEDAHIAVTEDDSKVLIGNDCMFAYDIDIRTGDSHSIIDTTTNERTNRAKDIIFGSHIWVAAHCTILKDSKVKSNSIIATRSVVTKRFEKKNVLIGGCPAKMLKNNVDWTRQRL
jgi:acetyltransferase-like isoleucine patch superfamily enzyme